MVIIQVTENGVEPRRYEVTFPGGESQTLQTTGPRLNINVTVSKGRPIGTAYRVDGMREGPSPVNDGPGERRFQVLLAE